MASTDFGMFSSLVPGQEDERPEEMAIPVEPTPEPEVTPSGNDFGMFADLVENKDNPRRNDSALDVAVRAGQNFVRGAIDPIASLPAAAELAARPVQKAAGYQGENNLQDTLGFKTTKFLKDLANLVGEPDPTDTSMVQQVAQGFGSAVGIGVPSLIAGVVGSPAAGVATGAGLGSASMAVSMFEEAIADGADEDTALLYAGAGGLIGMTDILPIATALKLLPGPLRAKASGEFLRRITHIAASAGENAAQEYGQTVLQNLAANGILDQDREWDEGALESLIVGAIVGGGLGTAGSFIKPKTAGVEAIPDLGPSAEEQAALATEAIPDAVDMTPSTPADDPTIAAALETPADRARRVIEGMRAAEQPVTPEGNNAVTEPEPVAEAAPEETVTPEPEPVAEAAPEEPVAPEPDPVAEAPGADTALPEDVPVPQLQGADQPEVAAAPEDTIPTVPESPETIELQRAALVGGKRMAVLYPFGSIIPQEIGNARFKRINIPKVGVLDYDSRQINAATIRGLNKLGKLNEVLGLGPASKEDVAKSIASGSPEVAVTERTPDGTEVKAAAGTEELAPAQVAAMEEQVTSPGNTVQVETPEEVIEDRVASTEPQPAQVTEEPPAPVQMAAKPEETDTGPRIFYDDSPEAKRIDKEWNAYVARNIANIEKEDAKRTPKPEGEVPKGKHWMKKERAARMANNLLADEVVKEFAPIGNTEEGFMGNNATGRNARAVIRSRAEAMVAAAKKAGVKIPRRDRSSSDKTVDNGMGLAILIEARDLLSEKNPTPQDFNRFIVREFAARTGDRETIREERRTEGSIAKAAGSPNGVEAVAVTSQSNSEEEAANAEAAETDSEVAADALSPAVDIEDVQTKTSKSARMGVRGIDVPVEKRKVVDKSGKEIEVETAKAASGDKLTDEQRKQLIEEMNRQLAARRLGVDPKKMDADEVFDRLEELGEIDHEARSRRLHELLNLRAIEGDLNWSDVMNLIEDGVPIEFFFSTSRSTIRTAQQNITKHHSELKNPVQRLLFPLLMKKLADAAPDVRIYAVPQEVFSLLAPGADGYYRPDADIIVIPETLDGTGFANWAHVFQHEAAHAVFYHALRQDKALYRKLEQLMEMVKENNKDAADLYGFTNVDEFLSEAFSNPDFQNLLANTPIPLSWWKSSGLPKPANPAHRNVLAWLKAELARLIGATKNVLSSIAGYDAKSAFDIMVDVGGALMERAPAARERFYEADADGVLMAHRKEQPAPKSIRNRLEAAGLRPDDAKEIADLIENEFDGKVTDAEFDALVTEFTKPVTTQSDLDRLVNATPAAGKAAMQAAVAPPKPPAKTPPTATKPTGPKPKTRYSRAQAWALKVMTLDFIRQRYGALFVDDNGTKHLDGFIEQLQRRDAIAEDVAKPHNEDAAEFMAFARKDPQMADKMASLAMDATRFDVQLGPGSNNDHLGINAKRGLQAKQQLAQLNVRYAALSPEAKKLYQQMTKHYRDSHNKAKRQLAENVLDMLDLQLSQTDRDALVQKVLDGTLTDADAQLINNPTIFNGLKNAAALRAVKGDYFPQMRFGDHVVVTTEKIDDPGITRVLTNSGKPVKVTTEVTGGIVRFTVDPSQHGAMAALERAADTYAKTHDLQLMRYSKRWRDRATGEYVAKGDQLQGHTYDFTVELAFQTKGVHYFDTRRAAEEFRKQSTSHATSKVLPRRSDGLTHEAIVGTDVSAIVARIDRRTDLPESERKAMKKALEEAIVSSLPGNRAPARYQARRNVLGASRDLGRAAATYGDAQGNFMATLQTAPKMRDHMAALGGIERQVYDDNAPTVQAVMNELRRRVEKIENPDEPNKVAQTISTLSFFDKLVSPAYSIINAMQPLQNTLPYLGGKYGYKQTSDAMLSAYHRMGVVGTIGRGVGNTAKSFAKWMDGAIDTSNVIGSVRQKLGPKYDDLMNELIARGAINQNAGMEIAQAMVEPGFGVRSNIARFDRAARQLPNAVEIVNRTVTAVAAYDLAKKKGYSEAEAIQEAFDVVIMTQGDYRSVNTPIFMKHGLLSFAMQFRKFALLQTQLYADMFTRIMKGATPQEKIIAAKQLAGLMTMQVLLGGALGLPGLEIIKAGVTLLSMIAGTADWDDWEDEAHKLLAQVTGEDWATMIEKGILSRAIGVDVSTRMSQADLWTGFGPKGGKPEEVLEYLGGIFIGAPGQSIVDWTIKAPMKLREGDVVGALELWLPIKGVSDTIKGWRQVGKELETGEVYGVGDAIVQAVGFRPAKAANASDLKSRNYRAKERLKAEADKLRAAYLDAKTHGERARIKGLIRDYNKRKKPEGVTNISLENLTKKAKEPTK